MPVIKSAKKRMRQNIKRHTRNLPVKSKMKTMFKKGLLLAKEGKTGELTKLMPEIFSIVDTAVKKNLLHENNASRKKSRLSKALNELQNKGGNSLETPEKEEKEKKKKKPSKKTGN